VSTLTQFFQMFRPSRNEPPDLSQVDNNWAIIDTQLHVLELAVALKAAPLKTTGQVKTGSYTAAANEVVRCDPSAGAFTVTLPTNAPEGALVIVRRQAVGGANAVSVARGGLDTIGGASTTVPVTLDGETLAFLKGPGTDWTVAFGQKSLSSLDARYLVETVNTVATAGAAQTIPAPSVASVHKYTLTAALCTFTLPAPVAGASFSVTLVQDGTGGRFATFTGAKWPAGTAPALSTGAGKIDDLVFACTDTAVGWKGYTAGLDMR
jgi:hypothetical protein